MKGTQPIYGTPDDENPEWTAEMWAQAKPATEVFPAAMIARHQARRRRGLQKTPTKQAVSLRLDAHVLAAFRGTGRGWQSRINAVLVAYARRSRTLKPAPRARAVTRHRTRRPS